MIKWRTCGSSAVIREFAVIEVAFEENKIRTGQVQEEIRRLAVKIPERVPGAPERMLLVDPNAIFLILLRTK